VAYIIPADFHAASLKWWCKGLTLEIADIPDADMTAVIAAVSDQVDEWCYDHFETVSAVTETYDGYDLTRLAPRRRIQSITTVEIKQYGGAYFTLDPTYYEVVSSITGSTVWIDGSDYISVGYGRSLPTPSGRWPHYSAGVRITGNFGWPACPDNIKRVVALLAWDHVKPVGDTLRRAQTLQTESETFDMTGPSTPSGLPEADELLKIYTRSLMPAVL
jgi:hypothetical protein